MKLEKASGKISNRAQIADLLKYRRMRNLNLATNLNSLQFQTKKEEKHVRHNKKYNYKP